MHLIVLTPKLRFFTVDDQRGGFTMANSAILLKVKMMRQEAYSAKIYHTNQSISTSLDPGGTKSNRQKKLEIQCW